MISKSSPDNRSDSRREGRGEIGAFSEEMSVEMERWEEVGNGGVWARHRGRLYGEEMKN